MEASVTDRPAEAPAETTPDPATAIAGQQPEEGAPAGPDVLFRYSTWVHVGPGAEACGDVDEVAGTNSCADPLHFHAWCRIPNQFQHREIRDKGLAAKARKARGFRDPETDAYAIIEGQLDEIEREGEGGRDEFIEELLARDWWPEYQEAVADVAEEEDPPQGDEEPQRKWAHVEDDRKRHKELKALPEAERPKDEYESLTRHLVAYNERIDEVHKERMKPMREALEGLDMAELKDRVRDLRIDQEADQEFLHVYNMWEWYFGTLKQQLGPPERVFSDVARLQEVAPEVVAVLQDTFADLEKSRQKGLSGNS